MSTRINVTVGDGGLLDRNAQQTAANRQARVLADQRAASEAEGVERRAADRTAAGLDPLTGLPASTPSSASTINRLDQEPAANRRPGGFKIGHSWYFADVLSSEEDTGLTRFVPIIGGPANSEFSGPAEDTFNVTRPIYIGSGNGAQWVELTENVSGNAPPLPADNTTLLTTTPDSFGGRDATLYIFTRTWGSTTSSTNSRLFVLPAGGDKLIVVYRQQALWNQLLVDGLYLYILYDDTGERVDFDFPFPNATLDFMRAAVPLSDIYGVGDAFGFIDSNVLNNFTRQDRCFIVSTVGLREISTPQPVLNILEQSLPTPVLQNVEYIVRRTGFGLTTVRRTHPTLTTPSGVGIPGFASYGFDGRVSDVVTPQVYQLLNDSFSFTDPANIKPLPTNLKWVLEDGSRAGYRRFYNSETASTARLVDAYNEEQSFAYGQWVVPGEVPPFDVWEESYVGRRPVSVPRATLRMAQGRPARQGGNFEGDFVESRLRTVFDWNDPGYCQQMLQDLGFTEADLQLSAPEG